MRSETSTPRRQRKQAPGGAGTHGARARANTDSGVNEKELSGAKCSASTSHASGRTPRIAGEQKKSPPHTGF